MTITYDVTDNNAASASNAFDIVVTGTNDAPVATFNAAQAVNEDAAPIADTLTALVDAGDVPPSPSMRRSQDSLFGALDLRSDTR